MLPSTTPRSAGFTLVEVLVALLILTIVILTSLAVFGDRARKLRDAGELSLAWQALANEAEARRRQPFAELATGEAVPFLTDPAADGALDGAEGEVTIEAEGPNLRALVLRVAWAGGEKSVETTVYRADTGGGPLW